MTMMKIRVRRSGGERSWSSVLPPGVGSLLQRLGGRRRLVRPVRGRRPGLAGGLGPQPATFDLCLLLGVAAGAARRSAPPAGTDPAGGAALGAGPSGAAAAEQLREEEGRPAAVGPGRGRCGGGGVVVVRVDQSGESGGVGPKIS